MLYAMIFLLFSACLYQNKYIYYQKLFFCFEKVTNEHLGLRFNDTHSCTNGVELLPIFIFYDIN